jgi:hypothetical protein
MKPLRILLHGCINIIALMVGPAVAQVPKGPPPKGAPAPLIGVGLLMVESVFVARAP